MKWALAWLARFSISTILCVVIGYYIDVYFHSAPIAILLCLAYAIGGNFYKLWKDLSE